MFFLTYFGYEEIFSVIDHGNISSTDSVGYRSWTRVQMKNTVAVQVPMQTKLLWKDQ